MLYIFAGDSKQAAYIAGWLGIPKKGWQFLLNPSQLGGMQYAHVMKYGTYHMRDDNRYFQAMFQALECRIVVLDDRPL
jgi:hypothetical protein